MLLCSKSLFSSRKKWCGLRTNHPQAKMKNLNHTDTLNAFGKSLRTKYDVFTLIKNGYNRKAIEETLKKDKSTILGHIRDLKREDLVIFSKESNSYSLTTKGYDFTANDFIKSFYGGVGWFPVETQIKKNYRYHNLYFQCEILKFAKPKELKYKEVGKNNGLNYFYKSYEEHFVKFHKNKAVLHIADFTAENIDLGSEVVMQKLQDLIQEIKEDGFILANYIECDKKHIADLYNPLCQLFKHRGRTVLIEGKEEGKHILVVDFSLGEAEIEAEDPLNNEDVMKNLKEFCRYLEIYEPAKWKRKLHEVFSNG